MRIVRRAIFLFVSLIFAMKAFSTSSKSMRVYFSYALFQTAKNAPYIETYLNVDGSSVNYVKNKSGQLVGAIQVLYTFKKNDSIIQYKKYNLISPKYTDSNAVKKDFLDLQRFALPNGTYQMNVSLHDTNSAQKPFAYSKNIVVHFSSNKLEFSDVEFIASIKKTPVKTRFEKNGYEIEPAVLNFFPTEITKLGFYTEFYNASTILGLNEPLLFKYYIKNDDNNKVLSDYTGYSRDSAQKIDILSGFFPIEKLASGNYDLIIEARDKTNKLLAKESIFFQRLNTLVTPQIQVDDYKTSFVANYTADSLRKFIASLSPISGQLEQDFARNQLKGASTELLQKYFLHFWLKRNATNPEGAWKKYHKMVILVNQKYSTSITKGYLTDRGRVYLKYGKPNVISEQKHNPSAYPYEIWQYYKTKGGKYSNKKFVFYETDIGTNDYKQLYSDIPGEISEPQWKRKLFSRTTVTTNPYDNSIPNNYGNHVNDLFDQPR